MAKFVQPGTEIDLDEKIPEEMTNLLREGNCVILIWSPWGVESVHDDPVSADLAIVRLRGLAAYQGQLISVQLKSLNPVI